MDFGFGVYWSSLAALHLQLAVLIPLCISFGGVADKGC